MNIAQFSSRNRPKVSARWKRLVSSSATLLSTMALHTRRSSNWRCSGTITGRVRSQIGYFTHSTETKWCDQCWRICALLERVPYKGSC
uniref:Uncharacterized protein n=1 Tax=Physcomitrium patens TaxID=3218 RepID=A0A2K1IY08_PHYPA|nr:hypothetical protein PHYPA_023980 [Physcomitrium patens]